MRYPEKYGEHASDVDRDIAFLTLIVSVVNTALLALILWRMW